MKTKIEKKKLTDLQKAYRRGYTTGVRKKQKIDDFRLTPNSRFKLGYEKGKEDYKKQVKEEIEELESAEYNDVEKRIKKIAEISEEMVDRE